MKRRINIGLIGVGRLGTMYAEFISYRVPQANLIAVADLIKERPGTCAEKYNVPKWYIGHQDLCDDKDIKAVIVVATTTNHKEIVLYAAKAGKSIFCEKPLTLNLKDARELEKGVQESGVFFQQGFQRRFDKGYMAAKKKIDAGEIGRPAILTVRAWSTWIQKTAVDNLLTWLFMISTRRVGIWGRLKRFMPWVTVWRIRK